MLTNSKKIYLLCIAVITVNITSACPVCERNQPKILRGIVHGAGPENSWDYISVWITIIITLITLYYALKWIAKPGETNQDHIKYSIFK